MFPDRFLPPRYFPNRYFGQGAAGGQPIDEFGWDHTPESGETQLAHARVRRQRAAAVACVCFTALVLTPELLASAPAPGPIEAQQVSARVLTQYQAIAGPVAVPAVVVPEVPAASGVIEAAQAQARRVTQYQSIAAPVSIAAVTPPVFDVSWTGPTTGGWNFVDGSLPFTTPGIYTLTFTQSFALRITGAAGGGGGGTGLAGSVSNSKGGGGGGGGATDAVGELVTVTAGPSYTATVGTAGGLTDFAQGATVYLRLNGGSAGSGTTAGSGGSVSVGPHAVAGQSGGFGGDESAPNNPNPGSNNPTGAGGGGGGGYAGNAGANGGSGRDQVGGGGGSPNNDGNAASGAGGFSGSGTAGGGGGGGGGVLLGTGSTRYGGGGGGGSGGRTSAGIGGAGSGGILVLAIAVPDGRPTADNGQSYPERAWQYQQSAAPVYFELTVPPVNEPPIGPSDGPASTIEAASVGRPRVVQYQAMAGPVLVRTALVGTPSVVYPSRLVRRAYPTSQQQATVLPPLQPIPAGSVSAVYPRSFDRRPARAAFMPAVAWGPLTPPTYPPGSADAVYPEWFPRRAARAASVQAVAWGAVTPETYPPGSAEAVYPDRLTRREYRASDQQAFAYGTEPEAPQQPPPEFDAWPVYPNRIDGRPPRAAYMPAVAWSSDTSSTYPLGSATAVYPRWFPRPAMLASQQQALGWSTFTPSLDRASEPVYPSSTVGRAARAAYAQAFAWAPVTPEVVPDFPLQPNRVVVVRRPSRQDQPFTRSLSFVPETPPPDRWTPTAPRGFNRKPAPQHRAFASPVYVPDVTTTVPPFPQTVYPNRIERRQRAHELVTRQPVYVPDMTDITPEITPPVYPLRLDRRHKYPQHLATAQPVVVIVPDVVPAFFGAVYPNQLAARPTWQYQSFGWSAAPVEDYPVGSATALYPRWFPLRAARAAYMQALGWHSRTPPDVQPGEFFFFSVYPRRLDRAVRMLPGYRVAPVYVPDVTAPPPTLQPPPVYPRRLDRRMPRPGTIPSRAVLPVLPPEELPVPPHVCVTAPPTAGCWPPDDEHPPSVKPIGRLGRQRP